jgi:hypothetical protein
LALEGWYFDKIHVNAPLFPQIQLGKNTAVIKFNKFKRIKQQKRITESHVHIQIHAVAAAEYNSI